MEYENEINECYEKLGDCYKDITEMRRKQKLALANSNELLKKQYEVKTKITEMSEYLTTQECSDYKELQEFYSQLNVTEEIAVKIEAIVFGSIENSKNLMKQLTKQKVVLEELKQNVEKLKQKE